MKRAKVWQTLRFWLSLVMVVIIMAQPAGVNAGLHRSIPRLAEGQRAAVSSSVSPAGIEIRADAFGLPLHQNEWTAAYPKPAVRLERGDRIEAVFEVEQAGDYTISMDVLAGEDVATAPEGILMINGQLPSADVPRLVFPVFYQNTSDEFPLDRFGRQILIPRQRLMQWSAMPLRDVNYGRRLPVAVYLSAGTHSISLTLTKESLYLGSVYIEPQLELPTYATYREGHSVADTSQVMIELQAELPGFQDNTAIRPINSRSLSVSPYDTYRLLLNTLGGESWQRSGATVYYRFNVPQDGYYHITLRALQNYKNNFTVFRRIRINGAVPFAELNEVAFPYAPEWLNVTLGNDQPFRIYLTRGENVLSIEATHSPYGAAIENIQRVLAQINQLSLEIIRLTGNQLDRYKEWVLSDYIPDIQPRLLAVVEELRSDKEQLDQLNQGRASQESLSFQIAIDNLAFLASDVDRIPRFMGRLSQGPNSAALRLSALQTSLETQPLALDKIFIHSPDMTPPEVQISPLKSFWEGVRRFWFSFRADPYHIGGADVDELEVWVNRPRQYVDLLQTLTDQHFTPQTGIRVKFAIMPDEARLVLANAAGIQPDVALGVSTHIPYELAIRNALMDLRTFEDFDEFIRIYSPGALLGYIINDSVYAIPETQDFWVTFYRRDILESLGLPVPTTWKEVLEILPELQRAGMNYNTPLSGGGGHKGFLFTAPFLFNHGAQLYSPDGLSSGLGSEEAIRAVRFMSEIFTIYGMPLATTSFYESFRQGSLPIGIANFTTYLQLTVAAPEIRGLWGIDLYPATVLPDGRYKRYATGSAQTSIMFAATDQPEEAWQFLKWWMSTPTQVEFQQQLVVNFGREFLWNSANVEAFQRLPIPEEHKAVILEQWQWMQEPVRLPGSYMQERELSNAWNRIVFDGVNPRLAIDAAIRTTNREITRKMEEFGFLQDGQKVKEFRVPSIEIVEEWMANAE